MDGFVSTSLRRAPSAFTDEQISDRQHAYEARLFRERGKIVIEEGDCADNVIVLAWFRNMAKRRFG
jgi:coenzyme F420-reducing hydrogenase gamma subunit